MAFSRDGARVAAFGNRTDHLATVWNVKKASENGEELTGEKVSCLASNIFKTTPRCLPPLGVDTTWNTPKLCFDTDSYVRCEYPTIWCPSCLGQRYVELCKVSFSADQGMIVADVSQRLSKPSSLEICRSSASIRPIPTSSASEGLAVSTSGGWITSLTLG